MNAEPQSETQETGENGLAELAGAPDEGEIRQEAMNVAKQTMVGDLRDACLQIIKDPKLTGKAWKDMTESEQKDVVAIITNRMTYAVVNAVQVISANGQKQVIATLQQVVVKDGIKAVLECSKFDELRHELMDAQGEAVAIVLSGAEEFVGVGEKPKIDKDQPDLIDRDEEAENPEEANDNEGQDDNDDIDEDTGTDEGSDLDSESADLT